MPLGLLSSLMKEAGSSGVVEAAGKLFTKMSQCDSAPAGVLALCDGAPMVAGWAVALGAGVLVDWVQGKAHESRVRRQFEALGRTLAEINSRALDHSTALARIEETLEREGIDPATLPQDEHAAAAILRTLQEETRTRDAALAARLDALGKDIQIYLSTISADVRETRDNTRVLVAGQDQILTEQQRQSAAIESLTAQIAAMQRGGDPTAFSRLEGEKAELQATVQRYVEAEKARGRPWREVVEELRHDPARLGAFIDDETERADRELVERHRERAAVWYTLGDIDKSLASVKKILALAEDDLFALTQRGHIHMLRGHLDAAAADFRRVGELATDDAARAVSLGNLGLIERTRGNLDAAAAYHKKSLAIEERLGRTEEMAADYGNLGLIERTRGNLDAAETYHKKALAIDERLGRPEGMANQYGNLGLIERKRGNLHAAEAYHKKSLAINERLGRPEGMANQYANLGGIEQARGNLDAACRLWTQARDLFRRIGAKDREALVQSWLDKHCPTC